MIVIFGHGRLGVGVEQLGAVADDPAPLLLGAREEAGHVAERDQRDVEGVAGADEAAGLAARVDVEHAGELIRLVADDPDAVAVQTREAADDVARVVLVDLEELAVVDDQPDRRRACRRACWGCRERRDRAPRPAAAGRRSARPAAGSRGCSGAGS